MTGILTEAKKLWEKNPDLNPEQVFNNLPLKMKQPVGGDTTCVEVRHEKTTLILDMGSGARRLGMDMMSRKIGDMHVLFTHTHWDHIQGWPFFVPAFIPGNKIHFYSTFSDLEERLELQQKFKFFPVALNQMASQKIFHVIKDHEEFQIGSMKINSHPLIHPGGATAFKIHAGGRTLIFATDTEFYGENLDKNIKEAEHFFQGADVLLMDAQYSLDEAPAKVGWGHTSVNVAIECALSWSVKKIILTHHEPLHNDSQIYELHEGQIQIMKDRISKKDLSVETAVEQMEFEV
jgi:phosphoribosyl 1,2-cyclic phosphodiesterase